MTPRTRLTLFGLIPIVVALDQWTKWLVLNEPRFNALACLPDNRQCGQIEISGIFDLTMLWNRGVSFGLGQSEGLMRWVLVGISAAIAVGFAVWLVRVGRFWTGLALALVVGGALGNVYDRIVYGAVVDFLDFSGIWRPYFFNYVFNIADAAISVGAVLLFWDQFLMSRDQSSAGADTD